MATLSAAQRSNRNVILTLPFNPLPVSYNGVTKPAIDRSIRRWSWFTQAQKLYPSLGTLSYLPVEVRLLIWRKLVEGRSWQQLVHPDMFHMVSGVWEKCFPVHRLREAIPLAGLEFDQMHLSTVPLHFGSAKAASEFWDHKITPWQLPWIRNLSFTLESDSTQSWLHYFHRALPPNLKTVTLDFQHATLCLTGNCSSSPRPGTTTRQVLGRKHHRVTQSAKRLERDLALFEVIAKVVAREAPQAVILLGQQDIKCQSFIAMCKGILTEIER